MPSKQGSPAAPFCLLLTIPLHSTSMFRPTLTNTSRRPLRERELVQSLAETRWRLNRSFALEAALFSQIAADAEEGAPAPSNIENLLKYEKTLKNLHPQEARLHRRFDKDLAELRELQQTRMREEL
jgi:hypothetical protein